MADSTQIDPGILKLEAMIGLSPGFFSQLTNEDDWSFVIKLHALCEAACTHLLLYHLKEPKLANIIARIEMSSKPVGKAAMLGNLGLLLRESRRFLSSLSSLRNTLVHDVRNTQFSFQDHIASMSPDEFKVFAIDFSPGQTLQRRVLEDPRMRAGATPEFIQASALETVMARARTDPKRHIWLGAHDTLASLVGMYDYSDYKNWVAARSFLDDDGI